MSEKFPLNIEILDGEVFLNVQDLINMLVNSGGGEETFDRALFSIASDLKKLKNNALNSLKEK